MSKIKESKSGLEGILGYLVPAPLPWQGHLPLNALLARGGQLRHGPRFVFVECCESVVSLCGPGWQCALTFQEKYLLEDLVTSAVVKGKLSSHWTQLAVLQEIRGSHFWPGT